MSWSDWDDNNSRQFVTKYLAITHGEGGSLKYAINGVVGATPTIDESNFFEEESDARDWIQTHSHHSRSVWWVEKRSVEKRSKESRTTANNSTTNSTQHGGTHYKDLKIQTWDYIHQNGIPYMEGCAIKYLTRWRGKGGVEDLKKAKHFIEKLIEMEEEKSRKENK